VVPGSSSSWTVCHAGHDPKELVGLLMSREAKPEIYGL